MFLPEVHQSEMVTAPDSKDVYVKMRNVLILCAFLGILGTPKVYLDANNEKITKGGLFRGCFYSDKSRRWMRSLWQKAAREERSNGKNQITRNYE